ncbi:MULTISPECIES: hypothetical protein [Parabacteroides]|uniref:hypothetical protein n=1 Tax=Parabacteroides TaxID=375288 RepID=UPI0011C43A1A|nr:MULTISPECIES: hypothetical protein [Parabacteroides]MDB9030537.1 hypothetical protein [Parabacteroides distasonis]MDB9076382.1 hypothetical protein [Parabacteroides distasonis]
MYTGSFTIYFSPKNSSSSSSVWITFSSPDLFLIRPWSLIIIRMTHQGILFITSSYVNAPEAISEWICPNGLWGGS